MALQDDLDRLEVMIRQLQVRWDLFFNGQEKKPLPYLYARTAPFLIILAIGVLLITYLDVMTTGIVKLAR